MSATAVAARDPSALSTAIGAGFVSRSLAMLIDLAAIVGAIVGLGVFSAAIELVLPGWSWLSTAVPAALAAASAFVPLVYLAVPVAVTGRTPGKAVMGLRVVRADGRPLSPVRSVARALAYVVSLLPVGLGFIWVLFDGDRRAWHDHLVGSRVVYQPEATKL